MEEIVTVVVLPGGVLDGLLSLLSCRLVFVAAKFCGHVGSEVEGSEEDYLEWKVMTMMKLTWRP